MIFRSLLTLLFTLSLALSGGACVVTSVFCKDESALSHTLKLRDKGSGLEEGGHGGEKYSKLSFEALVAKGSKGPFGFIGELTDVGAMLTGAGATRGLAGRAVGTTRGLAVRAGGTVRDLAAKALISARARLAKLKSRPKPKPRRNLSDGGEFDGPALRMGDQPFAPKGAFPKKADNLLSELPRDAKGRIYPSDKVRIRPEQHPLKAGETYAPRHHGQHYHVEIRKDVSKSWNNKKNVIKVKPNNYVPGEGAGFLPGEKFPGLGD